MIELEELIGFIEVDNVSSCGVCDCGIGDGGNGGGAQDVVHMIMSKPAVWHKSCRDAVDNHKVGKARKRHEESLRQ